MIGNCRGCDNKGVQVKKVDGGSAGTTYLCRGCYNDIEAVPLTPNN